MACVLGRVTAPLMMTDSMVEEMSELEGKVRVTVLGLLSTRDPNVNVYPVTAFITLLSRMTLAVYELVSGARRVHMIPKR